MCPRGSRLPRWAFEPWHLVGRRHVERQTSVCEGRRLAKDALRIMALTSREACQRRAITRWQLFGKDPTSGRKDWTLFGSTGIRHICSEFFSNVLDIIASHIQITLSPSYTPCISCFFSHHILDHVAKNHPPRLKTAGCPLNTAFCATTSTSTHHKSSSHTCHSMVLGCCTGEGGRGR